MTQRTGFGAALRAVLALALLSLALVATQGARPPSASMTQQDSRPGGSGDVVGAEACAECHAEQYAAWTASTHGNAGGPPTPDVVIAPFDGTAIRFADAEVIPSVSSAGAYIFTILREGRPDVVHRVTGVIGGGHMVGGGTQGFVTDRPDGTVRFLPFDYSAHEQAWFCNTARIAAWWTPGSERDRVRRDEGWVLITEELRLAECGDWPPTRVLGTDRRFANCQGCHGSQITLELDPGPGDYVTRIESLAINCESCHGPAGEHVRRARAGTLARGTGLGGGVGPLGGGLDTLDADGSLAVCFQCHALKRALQPGYLPSEDFETHYSLLLAEIGDSPYYPDGRIRTFGYQMNHRQSACYLDGSMTCVDCHDPHGQGYRDNAGAVLPGRFNDGQCLGCHASKAADVTKHTGHAPGSEGSRCVSCHMPYLQQPELGTQVRYARSDHTIPLPRPGEDEAMGVPSACLLCHQDRSTRELAAWAADWWGTLKPHEPVEAALLSAESGDSGGPSTEQTLALLAPGNSNDMALVAALDHLSQGPLGPDRPSVDPRIEEALRALAHHEDIDVSAVALSTLHLARGDDPDVRSFLSGAVEDPPHPQEALVRRWVAALRLMADRHRRSGDPVTALQVARKALEIAPTAPGVLLDMGGLFDLVGDPAEAREYYRRSLEADPDQSVAWVNLGRTLEAAGDTARAARAYEQALSVYSGEALAHLNLGNLVLAQGDYAGAMDWYRRATAADPGLSTAWFNLAIAYLGLDLTDQAARALRSALEFDPDDAEALGLLEQIGRGLP